MIGEISGGKNTIIKTTSTYRSGCVFKSDPGESLRRKGSGEHNLTIDAATGDMKIEGKNTSHAGGKSFESLWKKRV
jgi:hypothetical protein